MPLFVAIDSSQILPKSFQNPSKFLAQSFSRSPNIVQKAPKRPQRRRRDIQECPRGTQEAPKRHPRVPRGAQERPKASKTESRVIIFIDLFESVSFLYSLFVRSRALRPFFIVFHQCVWIWGKFGEALACVFLYRFVWSSRITIL